MQTSRREFRVNATRVIRQPVDKQGIVGTLFHPITEGPHPTVLLVHGSLGEMTEGTAAVLASAGFSALALLYFGADPLPRELVEIPLEYFAEAIAWLKTQPAVDPARIAVMGESKGGELALLLGATFREDIKAVIASSGSPLVWLEASYRPLHLIFGSHKSSWMLAGKPLPFLDIRPNLRDVMGLCIGRLPSLTAMHERALQDAAAVSTASIAVERINGPVLLVSHSDDRVWPATRLAEMAIHRLKAHNHPFPCEHLVYEGAGHPHNLPYSAGEAGKYWSLGLLGGNLKANGHAQADFWTKALDFLEKHLKND